MLNKSLFVLLALGLTAVTGHFVSGGSYQGDEKKCFDTCKPLVSREGCGCGSNEGGSSEGGKGSDSDEVSSGSGSGSGKWEISGSGSGSGVSGSGSGSWGEGEYCYLLQIFLEFSLTLEVEFKEIFVEWINITQITIVEDAELTEYQILVEIWYSLQLLFQEYEEIEIAIQFQYIGDWGYVCDLEGLALDIQTSTTTISIEEVITISGGSCPLFNALDQCKHNASASGQAAIEALIAELTIVIEGGFSLSETLVLIFEKFNATLSKNPDLVSLIYSGKIEGFGILQSFVDLCHVYWRIDFFSVACGGTGSQIELIESLNALWQNTSYSISERSDFKNLWNKTLVYFLSETSVELRVQYFVEQLYQLLIESSWDINAIYIVEIEGYGSIYDLIYAYIYCTNNGVGPGSFTEATTPTTTKTSTTPTTTKTSTTPTTTKTSTSTSTPTTTKTSTSTSTSTSTPTTTKTSTTPSTSTTTAPSTTAAPNCANVWTVNVLTSNNTLLLSSIEANQGNWTQSTNNTFLGYEKRIYAISANSSYNNVQKYSAIQTILLNFATPSTVAYQTVQAVYIRSWGYVSAYCKCNYTG